jgi:hypothetical protein
LACKGGGSSDIFSIVRIPTTQYFGGNLLGSYVLVYAWGLNAFAIWSLVSTYELIGGPGGWVARKFREGPLIFFCIKKVQNFNIFAIYRYLMSPRKWPI